MSDARSIPLCRGQIQGGVVKGIGQGAERGDIYDTKGRIENGRLLDYLCRCLGLPMIEAGARRGEDPDPSLTG